MGLREKLDDKIKRKEQEIQELKLRIKETEIYLQALQDMWKMLPRDEQSAQAESVALRKGSLVDLARDFLIKSGKPLHITEILKGIDKENNKQNRISLAGSLNSYARRGLLFTAEGGNVFGLISQRHNGPPPDFGTLQRDDDDDEDAPVLQLEGFNGSSKDR